VFADETGILLNPLVRRTWAAAGLTPVLYHRLRSYKHLSAIGGLSISPRRHRLSFLWELHRESIKQSQTLAFLRQLLRHFKGPLVLLWDRLPVHRAVGIQRFVDKHPRLHIEYLPPYAPELNPVEYAWSWLKINPLANRCAQDLDQLTAAATRAKHQMAANCRLLGGFVQATKLPIRLNH
jgi:transposase